MFINILNTSQNNKEIITDTQTRVLNDVDKDFTGNSLFQGFSQASDFIFNTQENVNTSLVEKQNGINDCNIQGNHVNTSDELGIQNYISLEAFKGKMSQDLGFDLEVKNKSKNNQSDLNWQEGKVSIKKGKVKVECNYAFTPTKSSLRVRCIYCKKIYSSVKGFINHRGRCIYYKSYQHSSTEYNSQSCNNSNKYSLLNSTEKLLQSNQTFNSSVNTQHTDNSQYNTKINSGIQCTSDDNHFLNYSIDKRLNSEDRETSAYMSVQNISIRANDENSRSSEPNNVYKDSSSYREEKGQNINKSSIYSGSMGFDGFRMHMYAAISCLPKYILTKILRKRKLNPISVLDETHEQHITKEELVDIVFSGFCPKVIENNSELKNETNKGLSRQNKHEMNKTKLSQTENSDLNPETINSENQMNMSFSTMDESFQSNIPVYFRHSLPKDSDWRCYICKAPKNGKESMNMCVNCGYVYHNSCQSQTDKVTKHDWFCDFCKTHGSGLKLGSKFQIGELVWVNYKGTIWPGQIINFSKEMFEVIIFHIDKRVEKGSSELLPWSKGITSIDGLASKGIFVRETESSITHWQAVYKAIKYYMISLRSKQRRLPQINNKAKKCIISGLKPYVKTKKKTNDRVPDHKMIETNVFHPLPSEISKEFEYGYDEIANQNALSENNVQNNSNGYLQ
ncbi:PHD finger containing protein [Cryptosporidium canis]|uniref:PHD finger containing protein n=1 Tax=Cryptosporidium canis TaxID=195482 RepID=A0A9D5HWG1_9CRYT|nr:PHD finger containing protein [Cryptosporidium canis]